MTYVQRPSPSLTSKDSYQIRNRAEVTLLQRKLAFGLIAGIRVASDEDEPNADDSET